MRSPPSRHKTSCILVGQIFQSHENRSSLKPLVRKHVGLVALRIQILFIFSAVFFGCLVTCVAYLISTLQYTIVQVSLGLLGVFRGPVFAVFIMGTMCPWSNEKVLILLANRFAICRHFTCFSRERWRGLLSVVLLLPGVVLEECSMTFLPGSPKHCL